MIDVNRLFSTDKKDAIAFYEAEHDLSVNEREKLHQFFEGAYKTSTVAKSFVGISAGLTMVWLIRRKRVIKPTYGILGGFGLSAFVYSFMTPTIFQAQLKDLEAKCGSDSKILKVVQVTPEPAQFAYYWSQYFQQSILDKSVRLKNPRDTENSDQFVDADVPFGMGLSSDNLVKPADPANKESKWESIRESNK